MANGKQLDARAGLVENAPTPFGQILIFLAAIIAATIRVLIVAPRRALGKNFAARRRSAAPITATISVVARPRKHEPIVFASDDIFVKHFVRMGCPPLAEVKPLLQPILIMIIKEIRQT